MAYKNPEDAVAYKKAWYEKNKEKLINRAKARYQDNKEEKKAYDKAYRKANKNKVNKIKAEWKKRNLAKCAAEEAKRKAAKLNRTPSWLTEADLDKIVSIYIEAGRKTKRTGEEWHVDHIIPLQGKNISGLHVPDNLQVIKATENISKHNRYTI